MNWQLQFFKEKISVKPELLALAFIFNKIKRGARFLRLLQVCVRKHIPQLLFILS